MAVSNENLIQGGSNSKEFIIILNGKESVQESGGSLLPGSMGSAAQGKLESPFSQLSALPPQSWFCLSGTSGLFTKALPTLKQYPKGRRKEEDMSLVGVSFLDGKIF